LTGESSPAERGERKTHGLRFLLSLAVSAGLCALLLRQIDLHELARWLTHAEPKRLGIYAALSLVGLLARAFRYRMLIGEWVGYGPLVLVTAARNFLVDLFPARVGSLSYVYLLTRRFGAPLEPVLSSFVVTFFYDLFAMTLLLGTAIVLELGRTRGALALGSAAVVLGAAVTMAFVTLVPALRRISAWVGTSRGAWLAPRLERLAQEVERTKAGGGVIGLLAISFVIRFLKFAAYWALLLAVVHDQDLTARELPFWRVFLGIAGAELSATLPIHGIAGIGTYETAWSIGFQELGVSERVAILSGFATHLLSQLFDYSLGLIALAVVLAWPGKPEAR
jgi:hypothetical protein